jgi:hypothetical protein
MKFDSTHDGAVTVDMSEYVKTVIGDMPEDMVGKAPTPAANHLFDVRDNVVKLDKEKSDTFHKMVMQLQYLSQRAWQCHSYASEQALQMRMTTRSCHGQCNTCRRLSI